MNELVENLKKNVNKIPGLYSLENNIIYIYSVCAVRAVSCRSA